MCIYLQSITLIICEMFTEFLDTYNERPDLCLGSPGLPSESAESNGYSGCPILDICFQWDESCPRLHGLP